MRRQHRWCCTTPALASQPCRPLVRTSGSLCIHGPWWGKMKSFVLPQVARFWRPSDLLPVTFQSLNLSDKHFRMLGLPPKNIKACAQVLPETCRDETAYETTKMTQTHGNNGIIMKSKVIKRSETVWKDQIRESWAQDHCKASSIRWLHRLWIEVTKDLAMTLELLSRLSGLSLQSTLSQGLWNVDLEKYGLWFPCPACQKS